MTATATATATAARAAMRRHPGALTAPLVKALLDGTIPTVRLRLTPPTWRRHERNHPDLEFRWAPRVEKEADDSWRTSGWVRRRQP